MAAQIAPVAPAYDNYGNHKIFNNFQEALDDISEQFEKGINTPTVALSKIDGLGSSAVDVWIGWIEHVIQKRVKYTVDRLAGVVSLYPVGPMSTTAVATSNAGSAGNQVSSASQSMTSATTDKVPRPPNAFIIYRQEWHPKVVEQNPGLHNNEISKIIGRMWREETEAVRSEYKRKAEDAKRQHAIDHPGYQYQPRKPSEKKKRMTKNKLAKLRVQANAATAPSPMEDLNEMLANAANDKQVTIGTVQAPNLQGFPNLQPSGQVNNLLTFDANGDHEMQLYNDLVAWNAANPRPPSREPAVLLGQQLADGQTIDVSQLEIPYSFTQLNEIYDITVPSTATVAPATCFHDATAEVERQELIANDVINELFDTFVEFQ